MVKKDDSFKFQHYLHNQIPDLIYNLLRKTGYDTSIAIQTIDFDVIRQIEQYIIAGKLSEIKKNCRIVEKS